jgi:Flp pilus assembly protein TadG
MTRDRGSSAVELAILAPILLLILWLTIQFALWFEGRQVALESAQEAARWARQFADTEPAGQVTAESQKVAENYYLSLSTRVLGASLQDTTVNISGGRVQVTVHADVVSALFGLPLPVTETSGGPIECFHPAGSGLAC